jgi:hypothetical protein
MVSATVRNAAKRLKPASRYRWPASPTEELPMRSDSKAAVPVTALNFKKLPEKTAQARLNTSPTRKSPPR